MRCKREENPPCILCSDGVTERAINLFCIKTKKGAGANLFFSFIHPCLTTNFMLNGVLWELIFICQYTFPMLEIVVFIIIIRSICLSVEVYIYMCVEMSTPKQPNFQSTLLIQSVVRLVISYRIEKKYLGERNRIW